MFDWIVEYQPYLSKVLRVTLRDMDINEVIHENKIITDNVGMKISVGQVDIVSIKRIPRVEEIEE